MARFIAVDYNRGSLSPESANPDTGEINTSPKQSCRPMQERHLSRIRDATKVEAPGGSFKELVNVFVPDFLPLFAQSTRKLVSSREKSLP